MRLSEKDTTERAVGEAWGIGPPEGFDDKLKKMKNDGLFASPSFLINKGRLARRCRSSFLLTLSIIQGSERSVVGKDFDGR
jgi:hypothetical protein